jgi:putative peptidoglycan lipid II flippase
MFLSPLLLGISGVVGGVLQSFKSFFAYSLSPIFYNLGIIAGALFLAPRFGLVALAISCGDGYWGS